MNGNLAILIAVFLSVLLSVLMMASGVGTALEELFVGNGSQQPSASAPDTELQSELRASQEKIEALERRLSEVQASGTARQAGGAEERRLRELERQNDVLQREIGELYDLISLLESNGAERSGGEGTELDFGENVTAEEVARHLADSPALQGMVDQLRRQTESTAAEVYERKRREEEEAALVAQVEQAREALQNRMPQAFERMTNRLELDDHAQSGVTDALLSYHNDRLDTQLTAFREDWDDQRHEQHRNSMRETTVATMTSYGVDAEEAERIVRISERMARFTESGNAPRLRETRPGRGAFGRRNR